MKYAVLGHMILVAVCVESSELVVISLSHEHNPSYRAETFNIKSYGNTDSRKSDIPSTSKCSMQSTFHNTM